jgi:NADH dehydrogenase
VRSQGRPAALQLAASECALSEGDFHKPERLAAAAQGIDAVIHLVGIISETRTETFQKVHVESTRALLAAARAQGVRRWLQMSALGTRPNAVARYHQSKWAAEELVRSSGLDWTIFRPSIVLGDGSGFERTFKTIARWSPVIPVMGSGKNLLQPIRVEDVAAAFAGALASPSQIGACLDLAGEERIDLETLIRKITGSRKPMLRIPMPVARLQAGLLEFLFVTCLGGASPLTRDQLRMLQEDNVSPSPPCG